jgi:hypothetical protein
MGEKTAKHSHKHRIVCVEWEDSAQPISRWQWVDEYQAPDTVKCVSVGFLLSDTKTAIAIALSLGDIGRDRHQANGIMRIPKSAIKKITSL